MVFLHYSSVLNKELFLSWAKRFKRGCLEIIEEGVMMKALIADSIIGVFAFDHENCLVDNVLLKKDAETAAEAILSFENGKITKELKMLLKKLLEENYQTFVFENSTMAKNVHASFSVETETAKLSSTSEFLRKNVLQLAIENGFVSSEKEFHEWVRDVSVALTKKRVRKAVEKRDLTIAQAILSIDDLDKTINLFMGRIQEWYGLHFPELTHLLENQETYARLVLNFGGRENFAIESLEKEGLPKDKAEKIAEVAGKSMGAELKEEDMRQIQGLCKTTLELSALRGKLDTYANAAMSEVAPNLNEIAGSLLGARLIAIAGGLDNLAKMPASTIQVLGAEKALFRALKTGTRPPKHGLLFQHALIHEASRWQRGKVSRALAGKIAIAARIDAYGGKFAGSELKADLEKRVKEIREKYAEPPPTPPMQQWQRPQKRFKRRFKRGRRR
jgi:nucleolar protein 56